MPEWFYWHLGRRPLAVRQCFRDTTDARVNYEIAGSGKVLVLNDGIR